jgi:hypothetical protein
LSPSTSKLSTTYGDVSQRARVRDHVVATAVAIWLDRHAVRRRERGEARGRGGGGGGAAVAPAKRVTTQCLSRPPNHGARNCPPPPKHTPQAKKTDNLVFFSGRGVFSRTFRVSTGPRPAPPPEGPVQGVRNGRLKHHCVDCSTGARRAGAATAARPGTISRFMCTGNGAQCKRARGSGSGVRVSEGSRNADLG